MDMKILSILSVLVLPSSGEEPCILTQSGPSPYLIRIFDGVNDSPTYGHGSLIRQDKVLSTCTPFKDLPTDLVSGGWRLSGYNFVVKCEQRRRPLEIEIHAACKEADPRMIRTLSYDVALWTVEPFTVEGYPFLWSKRLPPPVAHVKAALHFLVEKKLECQTALFESDKSSSAELQPKTPVEFIDQSECRDMLHNISSLAGGQTDGASTMQIFCVHVKEIQWIKSENSSDPLDADWYSGAAVVVNQGDSYRSMPVGIFSRKVTVTDSQPERKNFRIVLGFHKGIYEFLRKSGVETSPEPSRSATTTHAHVTQSLCELTESGPHPYLIRISETYETETITYGHGSLIKVDKVLSTCTPYFGGFSDDLMKTNWKLTGYNHEKNCKQHRQPKEILMHESCRKTPFPSSNAPITHDFAIWTVEPFTMVGMPFLWGNGKPQPPPLKTVGSIIDSLLKYRKALTIGVFELNFSDGLDLQYGTEINFIDWFVCLDMLKNVTDSTGDMTNGLNRSTSRIHGFHDYFCGYDVGTTWDTYRRIPNPIYADRYSGAAVMYEYPTGAKVPIGLLSRGVTISPAEKDKKNFRIIMGFHKDVYDFLSQHGIEPSHLESEFKHSASVEAISPVPHIRRRSRNHPRNHQSRVHKLGGLWVINLTMMTLAAA